MPAQRDTVIVHPVKETVMVCPIKESVVVSRENTNVVESIRQETVVVDRERVESVKFCGPCPVGVASAPPDRIISMWTAGQDVNGHRVVVTMDDGLLRHADPNEVSDAHRVLGLSLTAGIAGHTVIVMEFGLVTESSWSWIPDAAVFVGSSGGLTQTQPTSGFSMILGFAPSPTSLFIRPCRAILLST